MEAAADKLITFLGENREWAFWIALFFGIAENLAMVSILIPSTAILIGVGAFVATGQIAFLPIFAGAAIGAVAGSTISWWLGWMYGDRILQIWPLKNRPELAVRGRAAFARYGPYAIIIGHFFGPLRPVAFLMCGMALMPFLWFQLFNVTGSVAWAYLVPKFGEVGGHTLSYLWQFLGGA